MSMGRSNNRLYLLIAVLAFGMMLSGCIIRSGRGHRHSSSRCPRGKVLVQHKGKYKCKNRNYKRGHRKHKHKHKHHRHH